MIDVILKILVLLLLIPVVVVVWVVTYAVCEYLTREQPKTPDRDDWRGGSNGN